MVTLPKGKLNPETRKRINALHKTWRSAVLARDKCCQVCGQKAKRLNAHHLIPREFEEYRWNVDNGMTLCVHHHTLGKLSAHKHPMWFIWWLMVNKPNVIKLMKERTAIYMAASL